MVLAVSLFTSLSPMVYTWWRFAGWYAWTQAEGNCKHRSDYRAYRYYLDSGNWKPSSDIWAGGYFLGFVVGVLWPLVAVFLLLKKVHKIGDGVNYVPKRIRDERHEQQLRTRIQELEREVGIR